MFRNHSGSSVSVTAVPESVLVFDIAAMGAAVDAGEVGFTAVPELDVVADRFRIGPPMGNDRAGAIDHQDACRRPVDMFEADTGVAPIRPPC